MSWLSAWMFYVLAALLSISFVYADSDDVTGYEVRTRNNIRDLKPEPAPTEVSLYHDQSFHISLFAGKLAIVLTVAIKISQVVWDDWESVKIVHTWRLYECIVAMIFGVLAEICENIFEILAELEVISKSIIATDVIAGLGIASYIAILYSIAVIFLRGYDGLIVCGMHSHGLHIMLRMVSFLAVMICSSLIGVWATDDETRDSSEHYKFEGFADSHMDAALLACLLVVFVSLFSIPTVRRCKGFMLSQVSFTCIVSLVAVLGNAFRNNARDQAAIVHVICTLKVLQLEPLLRAFLSGAKSLDRVCLHINVYTPQHAVPVYGRLLTPRSKLCGPSVLDYSGSSGPWHA